MEANGNHVESTEGPHWHEMFRFGISGGRLYLFGSLPRQELMRFVRQELRISVHNSIQDFDA